MKKSAAEKYSSPLAENLARLRSERGWSQAELAEKAQVSAGYIAHIEQRISFPRPQKLEAIANALGVEPHQLLFDPDSVPENQGSAAPGAQEVASPQAAYGPTIKELVSTLYGSVKGELTANQAATIIRAFSMASEGAREYALRSLEGYEAQLLRAMNEANEAMLEAQLVVAEAHLAAGNPPKSKSSQSSE